MDIKWRNRTLFTLYAFLLVVGLSGPLTFIDQGSRYLHRDYFRTPDFHQQLDRFISLLDLFELNAVPQQKAKSSITVADYEIDEYRSQRASLMEQIEAVHNEYEPLIQEAQDNDNSEVADFYQSQSDRELEDVMKLFTDDDYVLSLIRQEKEQQIDTYYEQREYFRTEYNQLQGQFDYFFRNGTKGIAYTSLSISDEQAVQKALYSDSYLYTTDYTVDSQNSLHGSIEGNNLLDASIVPYQGWIAVSENSPLRETADKYRREQIILLAYSLLSTILFIVCLLRIKNVMFARTETGRFQTSYHQLPVDVRALLLASASVLTLSLIANSASQFFTILESPIVYGGKLLFITVFATIGMMLTLLQGQLLAQALHSWSDVSKEWPRSLLMRSVKRMQASFALALNQVKDSFIYRNTAIRLLVFTSIVIGLGFIEGWSASSLVQHGDASFFLLTPILAIAVIAVLLLFNRQFGYLNRVAKAADELVAGRMPNELLISGNSVVAALAANMNALRRGVRTMQNEQAKSERLKTELITNVSHDLRTPLTSIITYAELLKSNGATDEERAAYVEIIDQKSKRLKTMIDDLFEVSTMASGNAKLIHAKTDLVQLMQQALAEYKEAMDISDVQFRISLPEEPIYALADGQKLWRAFDNLIGNMVKYSLNHTRAYIAMQVSDRQEVTITFKNVSKYEIGDNPDELFERFKRGDTSRHTEGSGLGLAIAKSIVDLHEGHLKLETDGDLFKASVILFLEDSAA